MMQAARLLRGLSRRLTSAGAQPHLPKIVKSERLPSGLTLTFSDSSSGHFPWLWLRDASPAPEHRLLSGQRLFETWALPDAAELASSAGNIHHTDQQLTVEWDGGERSEYPASFLRAFAPGGGAAPAAERPYPGMTLWRDGAALDAAGGLRAHP